MSVFDGKNIYSGGAASLQDSKVIFVGNRIRIDAGTIRYGINTSTGENVIQDGYLLTRSQGRITKFNIEIVLNPLDSASRVTFLTNNLTETNLLRHTVFEIPAFSTVNQFSDTPIEFQSKDSLFGIEYDPLLSTVGQMQIKPLIVIEYDRE